MGLLGPPEDKEHQREDDIDEKERHKKGPDVERIHGITLRPGVTPPDSPDGGMSGEYFPSDMMNILKCLCLTGFLWRVAG